jgi:hypothetical protein
VGSSRRDPGLTYKLGIVSRKQYEKWAKETGVKALSDSQIDDVVTSEEYRQRTKARFKADFGDGDVYYGDEDEDCGDEDEDY